MINSEKTVRAATVHAYETLEELPQDTENGIEDLLEGGLFDNIADIINENLAIEVEASVEMGLSRIVKS
jgi:hypothetical protein